ncbi:hypothetical protein PV326_012204, partial [Microctonus aethiopoides]
SKSQSNLNEIDKSEQKSSDLDRKSSYNWPPDHDAAVTLAITTTTTGTITILTLSVIAMWIIR